MCIIYLVIDLGKNIIFICRFESQKKTAPVEYWSEGVRLKFVEINGKLLCNFRYLCTVNHT